MATRANLIATYNANPTLQSRYTLPQYLDMFGFGQTTTPTPDPDPTPTPTPEVPGIPNIINQNLGGGGDGPQGDYGAFGNLDKSTRKEFNIDGKIVEGFKNVNTGLYQDYDGLNIQNLGIGSFGIAPMIANALGLDDGETKYPGLFDKVSPSALIKNPGLFKSFFNRQDVAKQQKLQAEIDAANKAAAEAATAARARAANAAVYASADRQGFTNEQGGFSTSAADRAGTSAGSGQFSPSSSRGRSGYDDGGRVYLYHRLK
tara:strand:- start:33 stop:812 length:780 start_codon:yes stop_codon:yes gene_type:complete